MISFHFTVSFLPVQKVRDSLLILSEVIPGHLYMHLIPSGQSGFQRLVSTSAGAHIFGVSFDLWEVVTGVLSSASIVGVETPRTHVTN